MKKKILEKLLIILFTVAVLLNPVALTGTANATEGGGGAYANGADDFMMGALPPPGTYFINYLSYYTASDFKDNNGNNLIPDFKLDVVADVFRFIHVTKYKIFGANWGMHTMIPLVYPDVTAGGQSDDRFGLGDIVVDPLILAWHSKNFHVVTGVDIIVPVGTYDKDRQVNIGRNYWTFEPIIGITYLSDSGIELSGKFMYDFNTKNDDTEYKSGQEFHFDYTVGYHINNQWTAGIAGYYYHQMTEDEINGAKIDDFEGSVFAAGPVVQYAYKNMNVTLKWLPEFEARNRPEGDTFWLKFTYAF